MRATDFVLQTVAREGVGHAFLVPGGLIDPFMPALCAPGAPMPVVAAHEGGAAAMADGYARATGRFGLVMGIGGPGATNMVTSLAAAATDHTPILVVTGEVATSWEGRGGFQDASSAGLDDASILRPVVARTETVASPALVEHHLRSALTTMAARRLPVHLSIPLDVQEHEVARDPAPVREALLGSRVVDPAAVEAAWDALAGAERVVVLAGAGVEHAEASADLVAFAERFHLPVATTLRAKGVFPEDHPLALGVFGYSGGRWATEAILAGDVDVLLVLGSGLNQRDTMFWDREMLPRRALVQVDSDPAALGRTWPADVPVVGDAGATLRMLMASGGDRARALEATMPEREAFLARVRASGPPEYDPEAATSDRVPIHPGRAVDDLRRVAPRDTVLVVDSGAHRAWCGHNWRAYAPRTYLSATNIGPMGWAVPAGVGAAFARPDRPVVVVTGDGCMLMHGMEVQTAARYGLRMVVVVLNNSALGNVWFRASAMGPGPEALTVLPTHDWAAFARSLGAQGIRVERPGDLAGAFAAALACEGPCVVDVRVDRAVTTPVAPWKRAAARWIDSE
ncbi:MAG: thiamine pyrophosphate-binding protein [Thermoleophilia bacterium]|nr:thiamine pyrophosphate-binding protein [Thermoleophilia bacterium]